MPHELANLIFSMQISYLVSWWGFGFKEIYAQQKRNQGAEGSSWKRPGDSTPIDPAQQLQAIEPLVIDNH